MIVRFKTNVAKLVEELKAANKYKEPEPKKTLRLSLIPRSHRAVGNIIRMPAISKMDTAYVNEKKIRLYSLEHQKSSDQLY